MTLRIVEVTWEDAQSSEPWEYDGKLLGAFMCLTVGILIKRDKEAIHLSSTLAGNGAKAGNWRIPAGMVKKIRTLGSIKVTEEKR